VEGVSPKVLREIESLLAKSIARYGIAGKVRVDGEEVVLDGPDGGVATEIGDLAASWGELAVTERQRRVTALARTLVIERGVNRGQAPDRSLRGYAIGLSVLALAVGTWLYVRSGDAIAPSEPGEPTFEHDEVLELEKRACETSSARAQRGETLTALETRGWVVELSLLRRGDPDVVFDPGLLAFVERSPGRLVGRFVWAGAPELSGLEGPGTEVEVVDAGAVGKNLKGATLIFKGRYVAPFFSAERRGAYVRIAEAISERLATTYAGLEARCAHLPERHAGAWFRAPKPSGAAAALVWFMGQRTGRFDAVHERADVVDSATLEGWLIAHGGELGQKNGAPTTLSFPFDDSSRARSTARDSERELGLR
jgi:hypothetical protein